MTTIAADELVTETQINSWCPPGMIIDYGGSSAPTGWLLCDGASYLRADYPDLFTAIGTTYGAADGTHFNVPDCRGRVAVGFAASGGHSDVSTRGNNEGSTAANRRPKHPHSFSLAISDPAEVYDAGSATTGPRSGGFGDRPQGAGVAGTVGAAGSANDAPAYIVLNKLIRALDP